MTPTSCVGDCSHRRASGVRTPGTEDAVELLSRVRGTGEPSESFVALLLCTCPRWDRATGRLIAAIERAGLLADDELDELAEAFLSDAVEVVYPLAWVQPEWLGIELEDPVGGRAYRVDAGHARSRAARREAAAAPLGRSPSAGRLPGSADELLAGAERRQLHARAAAVLGLLDAAAAALGTDERRQLLRVGLATGQARVRRAALELLTELDGPDAALRRAGSDSDATVRAARPRSRGRSRRPQPALKRIPRTQGRPTFPAVGTRCSRTAGFSNRHPPHRLRRSARIRPGSGRTAHRPPYAR